MDKGRLQRFIDRVKDEVEKLRKKLFEDFNYGFEWGYANQIYVKNHTLEMMTNMLKQWEETDETDEDFIKRWRKQLMNELIKTSPLGNSTNDASNQAKRLRLEAIRKLLDEYGIFSENT